MVDFYNFLFAWQLFPEKGSYEVGHRPKSGNYTLACREDSPLLHISIHWVSFEDQSFHSNYSVPIDGSSLPLKDSTLADTIMLTVSSSILFEVMFSKENEEVLRIRHEITPKGLLKITQTHLRDGINVLVNTELYHKQFSVLPYASSVAGAVIRQNEAGLIRHHALSAMEEQTHMQLEQIRQQIELLATQAREIQKRKELSMMIYSTKLGFAPVIGQTYYLYENEDVTYLISMIAPHEWGCKSSFASKFIAAVRLLADHTWKEVEMANR